MIARSLFMSLLIAGAAVPVMADTGMTGMHDMNHGQSMGNMQNMPMSEGMIRKVDAAAGKITIRHGELANLGMPPMTMTFGVADKAMLKGYKAGDKIRFRADQASGGGLMVTQMSHMH